jgi:hypothetical protein
MNPVIQLVAKNGTLYFPFGDPFPATDAVVNEPALLLCQYAAGDCDTVPWPLVPGPYNGTTVEGLEQRLACALYDERECNPYFPTDAKIVLPDGTPFDFDAILAKAAA